VKLSHPSLEVFRPLPLAERLFVRARLMSAPLHELASRVRGQRMVDVGCGHGLLCAMMAFGHSEREVVGIDIDPSKIAWARRSVGRLKHTRFEVMDVARLAELSPAQFDAVTIADVLYLVPPAQWPVVLEACRTLLRPGGQLLLKEAESGAGWKSRKAYWQERVMVNVLGKTKSTGGLGFLARQEIEAQLTRAGFRCTEIVDLSKGSSTPHVLFLAENV
jgi:2-polyprenyl-3-methyl-5-hydroxy-6-metoxy-1,4-benzoquinol methylase